MAGHLDPTHSGDRGFDLFAVAVEKLPFGRGANEISTLDEQWGSALQDDDRLKADLLTRAQLVFPPVDHFAQASGALAEDLLPLRLRRPGDAGHDRAVWQLARRGGLDIGLLRVCRLGQLILIGRGQPTFEIGQSIAKYAPDRLDDDAPICHFNHLRWSCFEFDRVVNRRIALFSSG